ncbi:nucleoside diphosphate-linked moiety X motif 8-like isoform X2 [Lytechinus variegatus]|uniref:nucleoside diphosphate-linked moiety X motif 8-like isoform X2 n=1 Tax=Lytechinus variegatus TaxID=7654 RepID=UPI001BB1986E|nr:nucleoside diphosphate-linked moiety X motif 8-like isoform X2 [Lytechinus variegatus]
MNSSSFTKLMHRASVRWICGKQLNGRICALHRQSSIFPSSHPPVSFAANRNTLTDCHTSHPPVLSPSRRICTPAHWDALEKSRATDGQPARLGSTSGMSGARIPSLGDVFSEENKERVMSSLSSKRTLRRFYTKDVKQRGAVVVPLCSVNREPCILFTLRTRTLKDHSGEVSFPGGKMDPTDGDVCHTALRELQEELGVDPSMVEVWGNLSPVGRERITVVPVIGYLGEIDVKSLKYNPDEVSSVFVMTLSHLCSPASQAYTVYEPHQYSGQPMAALPVFLGGEHRVWGLTAYILDLALQAIVPDHYRSLISQVKKEQATSS